MGTTTGPHVGDNVYDIRRWCNDSHGGPQGVIQHVLERGERIIVKFSDGREGVIREFTAEEFEDWSDKYDEKLKLWYVNEKPGFGREELAAHVSEYQGKNRPVWESL